MTPAGIPYRRDIDGLRALAVVPVVLFHAGLPGLGGGFVGVDVFFVISGFLITSLLLRDIEKDRFSIARFYVRRARRILPALTFLLLCVTAATLFVYSPAQLMDYGTRLTAAALFVANIQLWLQSGYFTPNANEIELLHLWSLSVEEQFYIFFPILLWAGSRIPRRRLARIIVATLIVSLLLSIVVTHYSPVFAFYLLPTRAWELLIGAVLALPLLPALAPRLAEAAAAVGLLLLLASVSLLSESTPFPGIAALLPCAGAGLIIYAGQHHGRSLVARALSLPPVVAIGLISYSLYLWHWPLLTLPTQYLGRSLSAEETGVAVAAAALLAAFSWKVVEQPFRVPRGASSAGPRRALQVAATTVLASAAVGALLLGASGLPSRVPAQVVAYEAAARETRHYFDRQNDETCNPRAGQDSCARLAPHIILWGDSHVLQIAAGVRDLEPSLVRYGGPGCPPLIGVLAVRTNPNRTLEPLPGALRKARACRARNDAALAAITAQPGVRLVILGGAWQFYSQGIEPRSGEGRLLVASASDRPSVAESRRLLAASLARTVSGLRARGIKVLLLGDVPIYREAPVRCLARALMFRRNVAACTLPADQAKASLAFSRRLVDALTQQPNVASFRPDDYLCGASRCVVLSGNHLLYMDADHLSLWASRQLARVIRVGGAPLQSF